MRQNAEGRGQVNGDGGNVAPAGRGDGEEGFAAWSEVFQAYTLVTRALERRIREEHDLALAGYEVLVRLGALPEGERIRMQDLARRVLLSKSGLSQLFTRLEKRGLVERRGDPENLRVTYATLTAEGREVLQRALPTFREEVSRRFASHLGEEEVRVLRRAMREVIRASGAEPLSDGPNAGARGVA